MTIAVLGARGQLGRDLVPRLPGEVLALTREDIDLDRPETIASVFATLRPTILVNCAAYNLVDRAESEPEPAFRTNTWGVREIARACRDHNCRLVHLSSDYVFGLDERRTEPLREVDPPGPLNVYGVSKLAGEYFALAASPRNLIVRSSGLYGLGGSGGKGGNFVETMLRLAKAGKQVRVVDDQRCTPTYTVDLAVAIASLIAIGASGCYHITSSGDCSWYEFAEEIIRTAGLRVDLTPISSLEFGAAATRPRFSVLSMEKLISASIPTPPHWKAALGRYLHERSLGPCA